MSDLNVESLGQWLVQILPDISLPISIDKFPGGQSNPTYRLSDGHTSLVLRRKPSGVLLPSAHAIEREYRLLRALHPTGFPVPRPIAICEDVSVIGSAFYVMELVEGCIFWDATLADIPKGERRAIFYAMVDNLAALHALDPDSLGLADFSRSKNFFARQIERWTKQYRAAQTEHILEIDHLIDWLPRTVPEQERTSIVHGDYRIDNLIYRRSSPEILSVLDWELATIGDPLADFSYLAMNWILPQDGRSGLGGVDLVEKELPTLDEVTMRYCERTGRDCVPSLHWYFAFNLFRLAAIIQGVKKRAIEGNASNAGAVKLAALIVPIGNAGWDQALQAGAKAATRR